MIALDRLEGLRHSHFLRHGGLMIMDSRRIDPGSVQAGLADYPADIADRLGVFPIDLIEVDAHAVAHDLGEVRAANIVLLGIASTRADIPYDAWETAITNRLKPRIVELNLAAFCAGREMSVGNTPPVPDSSAGAENNA